MTVELKRFSSRLYLLLLSKQRTNRERGPMARAKMGFRNGGGEVAVMVEEEGQKFTSYYCYSRLSMRQCRICHEEERQSPTSMEAPCACSGTAKFAHRSCIQRWCDEKGSTLCEICLQNYEPGYTFAPKEVLLDMIGEVPTGQDHETPSSAGSTGDRPTMGHMECFRAMVWYRSIAMMLTIFLLLKHMISMASLGDTLHPYTLYSIFLLRTFGILVPFYVVMRLISEALHISR